MKKQVANCVWFLVGLCLGIFTITICLTMKTIPKIFLFPAVFGLVCQVAGLVLSLHELPNEKTIKFDRVVYFLLKLSIAGVALLLAVSIYALSTQYHNAVRVTAEEKETKNIEIRETEDLYILYPQYTAVELVMGERPSMLDKSIVLCSSGVFQQRYNLSYDSAELCGIQIADGNINTGYSLDKLGAFTFYDGEYHFANTSEAEEALKICAEKGGNGFQQYLVIDEGQIVMTPCADIRCFRVLAELDGRLCVIDGKKQTSYEYFAQRLVDIGVTHAMYVDMGAGWNYSWYRDNGNTPRILIGLPWPFSHNWVVFRK